MPSIIVVRARFAAHNSIQANKPNLGFHFINLKTIILPSAIDGTISAPPSKSVAQRALAAAYIRRGKTTLHQIGKSADELVVVNILREAGCTVQEQENQISIDSTDVSRHSLTHIDFGESGLAARMLIPIFALQPQELTFTGNGSLLRRPMELLLEPLSRLGVRMLRVKGTLPITIMGPLVPQDITVDGSLSSQAITGLIMAYVAAGANDMRIIVSKPVSKPYLDLTLRVLTDMGLPAPIANDHGTVYDFRAHPIQKPDLNYTVEGDWSSAAMLMVAGAIGGKVSVSNLDVFTAQGDKAVLQALMDAGARLSITATQIEVSKAPLKAFHFNAKDAPDLFPPLAVLAACAVNGTSVIEGIHRLRNKESDRAATLQSELGKMGVNITFQDDLMLIEGGAVLAGGVVDSHGDHRIAMACALAGLVAKGDTTITDSEAVQKSYPHFFEDLHSLGASILSV